MKNITRFTAAALAICSVLAVTGCDEQQEMSSSAPNSSNTPAQATTSATTATMNKDDADKIAEIDIGAEKLENGVVKFLSSWDLNPAEGQPVAPALEMFQSQFGGRIEYVNTPWDSPLRQACGAGSGGRFPGYVQRRRHGRVPQGRDQRNVRPAR